MYSATLLTAAEPLILSNMKILLNVRINLTDDRKVFTVWARPHRYLPGIEFYTGCSDNLSEAIRNLEDSLPESFAIDDEILVNKSHIESVLLRPFDIVKSNSVRTFILN